MKKEFIFIISLLLTLMACIDDNIDNVERVESERSQPQEDIHFIEVNHDKFWDWLSTHEMNKERVRHAEEISEIKSQKDNLLHLKEILLENDSEISNMERLEYHFMIHIQLSTLYSSAAGKEQVGDDQTELIGQAIAQQETALTYLASLISIDENYIADRAFPELELITMKCFKSTDQNCVERHFSLLETYRETPYGSYPEWFAVNTVLPSMVYYGFLQNDDEDIRDLTEKSLIELTKETDAVGAVSSNYLARHYLSTQQVDNAKSLIKNPKFDTHSLPDDIQAMWDQTVQMVLEFNESQ